MRIKNYKTERFSLPKALLLYLITSIGYIPSIGYKSSIRNIIFYIPFIEYIPFYIPFIEYIPFYIPSIENIPFNKPCIGYIPYYI